MGQIIIVLSLCVKCFYYVSATNNKGSLNYCVYSLAGKAQLAISAFKVQMIFKLWYAEVLVSAGRTLLAQNRKQIYSLYVII